VDTKHPAPQSAHPGITEEFQDVDESEDVTVEVAEVVAAQARRNAAVEKAREVEQADGS
jgi:hypothetical protein